mmetsp:Transcript_37105/g.73457  ORF Transcript_37105/g.73457 Transcript_37105/m.73457 type:complete len:214 (+) Transcript_37105:255-896(+)
MVISRASPATCDECIFSCLPISTGFLGTARRTSQGPCSTAIMTLKTRCRSSAGMARKRCHARACGATGSLQLSQGAFGSKAPTMTTWNGGNIQLRISKKRRSPLSLSCVGCRSLCSRTRQIGPPGPIRKKSTLRRSNIGFPAGCFRLSTKYEADRTSKLSASASHQECSPSPRGKSRMRSCMQPLAFDSELDALRRLGSSLPSSSPSEASLHE